VTRSREVIGLVVALVVTVAALGASPGCATTTPEDGLLPPERSGSTYLRSLAGVGIELEQAIELYGEDFMHFMGRYRHEVRVALARGRGAFVSDLAHVLGLPSGQVDELGALLRRHRGELDPPLDGAGPMEPERVRRFSEALVRVIGGLQVRARRGGLSP
jgi:hypothetical protein